MPGGFGTLDEFFEALTLVQTKKISGFPIIIFDKEFYKEILAHNDRMVKAGTISKKDENLFLVTDSIPEAIAYIKEKSIAGFRLTYEKQPKPFWGFFEKGLEKISNLIPQNEDHKPE
jgi:predicted Rossmann-fold nucleotide-binding protein